MVRPRPKGFYFMSKIKGQFWAIPKEIMAMHQLSLEARIVYAILWTRSNGDNICWPGQKSIAENLGVGERSIRRYLGELLKEGLIEVERKGLRMTNRYLLTGQIGLSRADTTGLSREATPVLSSVKEQIKKNIVSKKLTIAPLKNGAEKDPINDLIFLFKEVNPSVNRLFPNTNQRKSIKNLLNLYGKEKLEKIIAILPKSNTMPYAPVITTPTQLEIKVGALEAFVQKYRAELNKNKNTVFKV